jgi:hypothetical protein
MATLLDSAYSAKKNNIQFEEKLVSSPPGAIVTCISVEGKLEEYHMHFKFIHSNSLIQLSENHSKNFSQCQLENVIEMISNFTYTPNKTLSNWCGHSKKRS